MVCNCWMFTPPRFTWGTRGDALISSQSDAAWNRPIVSHRIEISWFNLHTSHGSHPHTYHTYHTLHHNAWILRHPEAAASIVKSSIDLSASQCNVPLIALDPWPRALRCLHCCWWILNLESLMGADWLTLNHWKAHSPKKLSRQSTCCTCSYWHPLHLHISSHHPRRCSAPCNPRWFSALKARSRRASTSKPLIPTILQHLATTGKLTKLTVVTQSPSLLTSSRNRT